MEEQEQTKIDKDDNFVKNLVKWTFVVSGIILTILFIGYWFTGHLFKNDIDNEYLGAFGDFVGGIIGTLVGLVTIYLVYKTFKSQKEELRDQKKLLADQQAELRLTRASQEKQNFENTFFNLLKSFLDLRDNFEYEHFEIGSKTKQLYKGVEYFKFIFNTFSNKYKKNIRLLLLVGKRESEMDTTSVALLLQDPRFYEPFKEYRAQTSSEVFTIKNITIQSSEIFHYSVFELSNYCNDKIQHYYLTLISIFQYLKNNEPLSKEYINILSSKISKYEKVVLAYIFVLDNENIESADKFLNLNTIKKEDLVSENDFEIMKYYYKSLLE